MPDGISIVGDAAGITDAAAPAAALLTKSLRFTRGDMDTSGKSIDHEPRGLAPDGWQLTAGGWYSAPMDGLPAVPPLAGLCSFEEAMRPGLSVDACVARLKRVHYAFKRLHGIFNARLTAEPLYELKSAFSYHAYLCAEHVSALRARVGEMREPPLGLEEVPDPALEQFFDEILAAPATIDLATGLYDRAIGALLRAVDRHVADTNLLADAPTVRLYRFVRLELEDLVRFGAQAIAALQQRGAHADAEWLRALDGCLAAAGDLDGTGDRSAMAPARMHSSQPYVFDGVPQRDARFPDPYNMAVNAEAFIWDERYPATPKLLMLFYKRLREIDVPEMMASIIAQTPGKPWTYYHDMSRQLWDEARHALMGEVGFAALGIDWPSLVRVNFTWSLGLNTQLGPLDRHAVLYFIEQGLMPRNGKRYEWEVASRSGLPLARTFQDYDWADEVLHARIGRQWYVSAMPSHVEALKHGDRCWSRVLVDWDEWRRQGLTGHENWWPGLYRTFCEKEGIERDAGVEGFDVSYRDSRADLKAVDG
jgi:hypothetical protein